MAERIQRKRTKGWKMPPNTVSVTRPGKFGNPYVSKDPALAVRAFKEIIEGNFDYLEGVTLAKGARPVSRGDASDLRANAIRELRGKNLACFCKLGSPCHADILLDLANRPLPPVGGTRNG
jgi:hypothetical protein